MKRQQMIGEEEAHGCYLRCPWTLHNIGIQHLLPAVKALDVRTAIKVLSCTTQEALF